ncbi:MAG: hypothetical protein SFU86_19200 [Pirellulaceae bacterium]|nr:hypothetical protein [Pirellulaceae bacterium]
MSFFARYAPSLLMVAVCLLSLARPLTGPISRYACAGMVYGAALPGVMEREAVVWIEGPSFGKSELRPTSVRGLARDFGVAQIHPNDQTLDHIVSEVLGKRWQNTRAYFKTVLGRR